MKLCPSVLVVGFLLAASHASYGESIVSAKIQPTVPSDQRSSLQPDATEHFSRTFSEAALVTAAVIAMPAGEVLVSTLPQRLLVQGPTASPVPEPSSLVLLATGALGLVKGLRRRRQKS